MSQLGNKIEHGLHAYTPAEQKACSMLCDEIPYELLASGR